MVKKILLVAGFLLSALAVATIPGQEFPEAMATPVPISQYRVEPQPKAMTLLTGTTTQIFGPNAYYQLSPAIDLPFTFVYLGQPYTQVKVSTNGCLTFDPSASYISSSNDLASTYMKYILAPFWDSLEVSYAGKIHYQTLGTAPNRTFVVEFYRVGWSPFGSSPCDFQVCLIEGTNDIEFRYGDMSQIGFGADGASIGINDDQGGFINALDGTRDVSQNSITSPPANNFRITSSPPPAKDVLVSGITVAADWFVGSPDVVQVTVENRGSQTQSGFPVAYQIGADPIVRENFTASVAPGATASMTFATPWNPQAGGVYSIQAWTELPGDAIPLNDRCTRGNAITIYALELPPPVSVQGVVNAQNRIALSWGPGAFQRPLPGEYNGTSAENLKKAGDTVMVAADTEQTPRLLSPGQGIQWVGITPDGETVRWMSDGSETGEQAWRRMTEEFPSVCWIGRSRDNSPAGCLCVTTGDRELREKILTDDDQSVYLRLNYDSTKVLQYQIYHTIGGDPFSFPLQNEFSEPPIVNNQFSYYTSDGEPYYRMSQDTHGTFTPPSSCSGTWRRGVYVNNVYHIFSGTFQASAMFAPPSLLGFKIYRSLSPHVQVIPANLIATIANPAATSFVDGQITPSACTPYYYLVTASYDRGESLPASEIAVAACAVLVIAPNGGETWQKGSVRNIQWTAPAKTGVVTIDLYRDYQFSRNLGTASAAAGSFPWTLPQDLADGSDYKVRVSQGSLADDSNGFFRITPDYRPTAAITSPSGTVQGTVNVQATAADDIGVAKVEFYIDNLLAATDTSAPYGYSWDSTAVADGSHTIKVIAYDTVNQTSNPVTVQVTVNNKPVVSLTIPGNVATVSGTVSVQATASGVRGVARVEFYLDNLLIFSDSTVSYGFSWDTTRTTDGAHKLKAIAVDTAGVNSSPVEYNLTVKNAIPGSSRFGGVVGVASSGSYVYVANSGVGLLVFDVSTPSAPVQVGYCNTPGGAEGVTIAGSYAYVADGACGLRIIDITNPAAPSQAGFFDTPGYARDVFVSGSTAYVADGLAGLRIINVANPAAPVETGSCDTPGYAEVVYVSGTTAYVADFDGDLRVIDVSNSAAPAEIGHLDLPGQAFGVTVAGSYAFVAAGDSGLRIVNVSDPANPVLAGFYDTFGFSFGVTVAGPNAYVADGTNGIMAINVSNPASPYWGGSYNTPGTAYEIGLADPLAFVADGTGLRVLNLNFPYSPGEAGYVLLPVSVEGVQVAGNYAYVAAGQAGLRILDVSTPLLPKGAGYLALPGISHNVCVSGNYAYVAADDQGLRIVNVTNPSAPVAAGFYDTPGKARDVRVAGNYAYVADEDQGLRVINVSNPAAPVETGFFDTPGKAQGVWVAGSYAYVADGNSGLRIVNVSTPSAPVEVGFLSPGTSGYYQVRVAGSYAYVVRDQWVPGFLIIDVSNPAAPAQIGSLSAYGSGARGVDVAGASAYVAMDWMNLQVVEISNPATPFETGHIATPGRAQGVCVAGSFVYVADMNDVFVTYTAPAAPTSLQASVAGDSQVNLAWHDSSSNEVWFRIERKTGASGTWIEIAAVGPNVGAWQDSGLAPGGTYVYRVRAVNPTSYSGYSNEASAALVPPAPSNLKLEPISYTQINLSWVDNSTTETGFKIERKSGAGSYAQIATVGANVNGYQDTGLTASVNYCYRVRAASDVGDSAYSEEACAVAMPKPEAATGLRAVAVSTTQINLFWNDNSSIESGFKIERRTGSGGYTQIAVVGANAVTYSHTGLTAATTYYYRVRAYNSSGDSAYSNEAWDTTFQIAGNFTIGGYLGVGLDSPERAVHIRGPNAVFRMDRSANTAAFMITRTDTFNSVLKSFVVGVNAAAANDGSFVVNDLGTVVTGAGANRLIIANDGTATFGGQVRATGFFTPSMRALKTDIRPLEGALGTILNLRGVRFNWRETGAPSLGFIADDTDASVPEVVSRRAGAPGFAFQSGIPAIDLFNHDRPGIFGLDYGRLTAFLVEGLKQQQREIAGLEQKRKRLKAMLEELQDLNKNLPADRARP